MLIDPARLDALVPDARGLDLLDLLSTTEVGDQAARSGVAVPVLGAQPGYYDLYVHEHNDPEGGVSHSPDIVADGWVLATETGELIVDPLAGLREWDPSDLRHRRLSIRPGTYAVQVRGHARRPDPGAGAAGSYSWVLRRTAALPWFHADLPRGR